MDNHAGIADQDMPQIWQESTFCRGRHFLLPVPTSSQQWWVIGGRLCRTLQLDALAALQRAAASTTEMK